MTLAWNLNAGRSLNTLTSIVSFCNRLIISDRRLGRGDTGFLESYDGDDALFAAVEISGSGEELSGRIATRQTDRAVITGTLLGRIRITIRLAG